MHPYLLIPLGACLAASMIASAILARDPGQRANRLVALALGGSAWWSLCEVMCSLADDPATALRFMRLSALGWVPLGAIAFHIFVEVNAGSRAMRRLIAVAYGTAAAGVALYFSPWCVGEPVRVAWGWGLTFGPLFPLAYVPTALWATGVLVLWPRFAPSLISPGERRQSRWIFVGFALPLILASATDVILPSLGIHVPRLGSASVVFVGAVVVGSVSRYGYFLLAPGAFTLEIVETLRDAVAILHPDGRVRSGNAALLQLSGRSADALRDTPIDELLPGLGGLVERPLVDLETELTADSGERFPVSVSATPLGEREEQPLGHVLAIRDLREVAALRSDAVTSDRLAAVGELAAGITHEINSPLAYVRSNLALLRKRWADLERAAAQMPAGDALAAVFDEGEDLLEESVEGIERVAGIVRDVGTFSHVGLGESERVDVNELLENALNLAALSFSVVVERCYQEVPEVRGVPHQLKQAFLNLLLNALHAVGDFGHIRLVTRVKNGAVQIRVEDDGCGIPAEEIDRVFDPFFTTRPAGEGTGLGLAHCYQIVRSHGGDIRVESQAGRGSAFEITLPA